MSANDETCATMDTMVKVAERWMPAAEAPADLLAWVRLRMRAYADGGWGGEREPMVGWIAMDLALDEGDAGILCGLAGLPS